ncbi:chemotaxis protein [Kordiimonas sediminis]|uniref:Chemotaxis protein n=1 Tax=Kordiimonas sediminis TaxID=1735581 RepID=A0A919AU54_9PROT|nr:methyl-accepting chemotaxis protein [Kordiimonas sediminis]GHF25719.1 chemotaxis protein [Kordiimonas sediminis]
MTSLYSPSDSDALPIRTEESTAGLSHSELSRVMAACRAIRKGDLEARLDGRDFNSSPEAEDFAHALNDVFDVIDAFSREVSASLEYVKDGQYFRRIRYGGMQGEFRRYAVSVNEAVAEMGVKTAEFKDMTTNIAQDMRAMIDDVAAVSAPVTQVTSAAQQTQQDCHRTAQSATETSMKLQSVAGATEELSSTIRQVRDETSRSQSVVEGAASKLVQIHTEAEALNNLTARIENVLKMITDIAKKTNLLALNATIEAARAGEAGRGFAVVAGEVKGLAGQTADATDEITSSVQEIREAMGRTLSAIQEVDASIHDVEAISTSIAASVGEQSDVVNEIAENSARVSQETDEFVSTVHGLKEKAGETESSAMQVGALAEDLAKRSTGLLKDLDAFMARL